MKDWKALSIRQPWVDLILRGYKSIEVREWDVSYLGNFYIHVSKSIDWRSAALFGYEDPFNLPRGGVIGHAEITECIPLTPSNWLDLVPKHRVVTRRRTRYFGAVLHNVTRYEKLIPCRGRQRFFDIPDQVKDALQEQFVLAMSQRKLFDNS